MNIAMVILNTCCFVWFFFSFFSPLLPVMKYGLGIRCTKTHSVSMFCSGGWAGGRPPAQGSQIAFWGIVRVSFWYRFFPVTFQKNCLHIRIIAATHASRGNKEQTYMYVSKWYLHKGCHSLRCSVLQIKNKVAVLGILTCSLVPLCLIPPAQSLTYTHTTGPNAGSASLASKEN